MNTNNILILIDMSTAHCFKDNKWSYINCYMKDNKWYNTETDEELSRYDIYWIED